MSNEDVDYKTVITYWGKKGDTSGVASIFARRGKAWN